MRVRFLSAPIGFSRFSCLPLWPLTAVHARPHPPRVPLAIFHDALCPRSAFALRRKTSHPRAKSYQYEDPTPLDRDVGGRADCRSPGAGWLSLLNHAREFWKRREASFCRGHCDGRASACVGGGIDLFFGIVFYAEALRRCRYQ